MFLREKKTDNVITKKMHESTSVNGILRVIMLFLSLTVCKNRTISRAKIRKNDQILLSLSFNLLRHFHSFPLQVPARAGQAP